MRACSLRGKFPPLNDKISRKVNSPRKKSWERHVSPLRPMFPKGGPISPRYTMKFTKDNFTSPRSRFFSSREKIAENFTSPRNLAGERHVSLAIPIFLRGRPSSLREEVVEKAKHVRCTFLLWFLLVKGGMWYNTKNFPKGYPRPRI